MGIVDAAEWTWVLHSSLLIAAIFGRFTKMWSLRNLDLVLLLALTPALLISDRHPWLLYGISALLATRLIFDCRFLRRPRVEPNMNVHGLSLLCAAAFVVLVVRIFTLEPASTEIAEQATRVMQREVTAKLESDPTVTLVASPAVALSRNLATTPAEAAAPSEGEANPPQDHTEQLAMRILALAAHTAVVGGLLAIGHLHFGSISLGLAMGTLYLLLPCTAFYVHRVNHTLPAALLVWAFASYRRPFVAGSLLALASGALFSTVFLLPLWCAFYGRKRLLPFGGGLLAAASLLTIPLWLTSLPGSLAGKLLTSMNWTLLNSFDLDHYLAATDMRDVIRPYAALVFFGVFISLTLFPRRKQLGHLIAHSAVLVVLAQFWYPETLGINVLWYLPVVMLVVFRPRLRHLHENEDAFEGIQPVHEARPVGRPTVATSPLQR